MKTHKLILENTTKKNILINILKAVIGLFIYGLGSYITIQAGIGTSPWDTLNMGVSRTLGIQYGTASICIGLLFVIFDILLKEPIGIGMLLDVIIVGKTVDLLNIIDLIPAQTEIFPGILLMLIGIVLEGSSQYIYMSAGLGCGPRDAFLVGVYKKQKGVPIGGVSIFILSTATVLGWTLGGTIGIGTIMAALLCGPTMQLFFKIMHFEPKVIKHQSAIESLKVLFK